MDCAKDKDREEWEKMAGISTREYELYCEQYMNDTACNTMENTPTFTCCVCGREYAVDDMSTSKGMCYFCEQEL